MENTCIRDKQKCTYLHHDIGRTNLNQKEDKDCYGCGLGQFNLTRNIEDLPTSCKLFKLRPVTKKEN